MSRPDYHDLNDTSVKGAAGDRTTLTWDIENRATRVALPGGTRNTVTYDGDSRRRRTEDSDGLRNTVWDGENILAETDSGGSTLAGYTLSQELYGALVSQRRGSAIFFHHYDALGSTRALTNAAQTVTDTRDYRAFGLTNTSSGSTINRFWWVGNLGYYWQPDTQDYWVRARVYGPQMGRWVSRDPVHGDLGQAGYRYGANRPVVLVDPEGLPVTCAELACVPGFWREHISTKRTHSDWVLMYARRSSELFLWQYILSCIWERIWTSVTEGYRERTWYCVELCLDICTGRIWSRNTRHQEVQLVHRVTSWKQRHEDVSSKTSPFDPSVVSSPRSECEERRKRGLVGFPP